jgi:DNA polymerase
VPRRARLDPGALAPLEGGRGFGVTDAERQAALEAIAQEVAACARCRLHAGRSRAVAGEGSADTEVVFVGEGPGEQEDRQGRPFVGASGQLLTELIESLGWRRSDVYITNVVKCRPPGNRDPQPDEIAACSDFLRRQLAVLDPAVVVTVGKHSLTAFRPGERIGRVHGTTAPADPATGASRALVYSMYHPAFALYQGSNRQTLFDDIAGLPAALLDSRAGREAGPIAAEIAATQVVATEVVTAGFTTAGVVATEVATAVTTSAAAGVVVIETSEDVAAVDGADSSGPEPAPEPADEAAVAGADSEAEPVAAAWTAELPDPAGQLTLF